MVNWQNKDCVEHYFEAEKHPVWRSGIVGLLSTFWSVATVIAINLATGGWITYMQWLREKEAVNQSSLVGVYLITILIVTVSLVGSWVVLRTYRKRLIDLLERNHAFAHLVRDRIVESVQRAQNNEVPTKQDNERLLKEFSGEFANSVASFFESLKNDHEIMCLIRLADLWEGIRVNGPVAPPNITIKPGTLVYQTYGRSERFSHGRVDTAIPYNLGVPGFFARKEHDCQGVLIYHDIDEA